jgi:hypothetical protein
MSCSWNSICQQRNSKPRPRTPPTAYRAAKLPLSALSSQMLQLGSAVWLQTWRIVEQTDRQILRICPTMRPTVEEIPFSESQITICRGVTRRRA